MVLFVKINLQNSSLRPCLLHCLLLLLCLLCEIIIFPQGLAAVKLGHRSLAENV